MKTQKPEPRVYQFQDIKRQKPLFILYETLILKNQVSKGNTLSYQTLILSQTLILRHKHPIL